MKKTILFATLAFVFSVFTLNSCTTLSKFNTSSGGTNLTQANFDYVGSVEATAKGTYVIGLAGGTPEKDAISRLKEQAKLKSNQALTNYSVTTSTRFILFGFIIVKTTTATADIVEFRTATTPTEQ